MILRPKPPVADDSFRRERFIQQVIAGLPLAEAVLTLQGYVLQPAFLDGLFAEQRGRRYEDTLTFPVFVQLIADILQQEGGSARPGLLRAEKAGTLPTGPGAFHGKLRRLPLPLSVGFVSTASARLQELLPAGPAVALPARVGRPHPRGNGHQDRAAHNAQGEEVTELNFQMRVSLEKRTGRTIAVYFQMREGKAAKVRELAGGKAFANYGSTGKLLGIELLAPCEVTVLDQVVRREPKPIKEFLRAKAPREMVLC